jgi:phthiocerol/phenolphthiocerol synthesis type-I polyketide synthase C
MTKRVAVIGYAHRFPGEANGDLWSRLRNGEDLVTEVSAERFSQSAFLHPEKSHPGTSYTFAAGSIGDIASFDADFFAISPREAALMDPQQRLLLEMTWEALENSGVRPSSLRGSDCGVFIGIASADYFYRLMDDLAAIDASAATGNTSSIAANRLSYFFDLRGPSIAIDTACSSSLVAFHQACQSILSGESTHAVTGGVSLHIHPSGFIMFSKASMLSRKGNCNVFDADGDGYVRSEGGGILYLKDYDAAVADGNRILAVVAGSAVNTDGRKSGLTVPSSAAQAALLDSVYVKAKISPNDIDYIEAHGTGTAVGDPIETHALSVAIAAKRSTKTPLLIGSVKSNMGHLEAASGVAGLVKSLLCIQHREVPATIGIRNWNPNIPFEAWNLQVATATTRLKSTGKVIVGTNSFGFGGANAHVILESYESPEAKVPRPSNIPNVPVVLSAKTAAGLDLAIREMADHLKSHPQSSIYDIAYTSCFFRDWHEHRAVVFGNTIDTVERRLHDHIAVPKTSRVDVSVALPDAKGAAFVYSGNGSQWVGMGKELLNGDVHFRNAVREVDAIFGKLADFSLEAELAGNNAADAADALSRMARTEIAQPALFAVQVGITAMLKQRGIKPVAVSGHSVGEVAAAWASGALTLEAAVKVIYHRSRLQGTTRGQGLMAAANIDPVSAQILLDQLGIAESVVISGFNGPKGVTFAGSAAGIGIALHELAKRRIAHKRLDLDYAFHSPAMDGIEAPIEQSLAGLKASETALPLYSTVTGDVIDGRELQATYWWYNIRQPVLFSQAINSMIDKGINLFIEVGPHPILRGYIRECLDTADKTGSVIPTIARGHAEPGRIWSAASRAMIEGASVDWTTLLPWRGRFTPLPNYPWQRERHWTEPTSEAGGILHRESCHPLLGYELSRRDPHIAWESVIDLIKHTTFNDHVVGNAVVFPGSGYAELAVAAAFEHLKSTMQGAQSPHPRQYVEIEALEITAPLTFSAAHSTVLQTTLSPDDGAIVIHARDHGSDHFVSHARARILPSHEGKHDLGVALKRFTLPNRTPDFTRDQHEQRTQAVGLQYGSRFKLLSHGWVENDIAIAQFGVDGELSQDVAAHHVHPAILDCAFQLIIQLVPAESLHPQAGVFVPIRIERLRVHAHHTKTATPHSARATLVSRGLQSMVADFELFDVDGNMIATLQAVRFQRMRVNENESAHLSYLSEQMEHHPDLMRQYQTPAQVEQTIRAALEAVFDAPTSNIPNVFVQEVDPLLDELARAYTYEALVQFADADGLLAHASLSDIDDRSRLDILLARGEREGLLIPAPQGWELQLRQSDNATSNDILACLLRDYPDFFLPCQSVARVGQSLLKRTEASSVLAQIDPHLLTDSLYYLFNDSLRAHIISALNSAMQNCKPDTVRRGRWHLTEIGNSAQLRATSISQCGYHFVGIDNEPGTATSIALATTSTNGSQTRSDIVVVWLSTTDEETRQRQLRHAKTLLADNGVLLVLSHHPMRWLEWTMTHATLRDVNRFVRIAQPNVRALEVGLAAEFAEVQQVSPEKNQYGAVVFVAKKEAVPVKNNAAHAKHDLSSAPTSSPRIFLFIDQKTSAAITQLASAIRDQGHITEYAECVESLTGWGVSDIKQKISDTLRQYGRIDDVVVCLDGLDNRNNINSDTVLTSANVVAKQCTHIAGIAAALSQSDTSAMLTVLNVLPDADANMVVGQYADHPTRMDARLIDAACKGWVRSLANEETGRRVRYLTVSDTLDQTQTLATTCLELVAPSTESEVTIHTNGGRLVPRLTASSKLASLSPAAQTTPPPKPTENVHLALPTGGQLKSLHWQAMHDAPPIGADQLEIDVHATGLNFRDVMFALGVLTEAAVESGFAGATLGLEFAGVVKSIGSNVKGYQVGDRVLGFGSGCFANRLTVDVRSIAHIPSGMSFEAAATIPCTFFTAYYSLKHLARVCPGERVLIHGAAGGVGLAAIQLAQYLGADIYATAGSTEKRDVLRLLGVSNIYDSRTLSFADEIERDTNGEGIDIVLNSLAGEAIHRNFRILKPFGRFIELGKRDFYENTKIGLRPFRNNVSYFGVDADQLMLVQPALTQSLFAEVMSLFEDGTLHALPYRAFEAENIVDAFRYMQQSRHIGKVVVNGLHRLPAKAIQQKLMPMAIDADGTYLVTGGLAGFGLRTAKWLASKGAKHLVLISRSGVNTDEARDTLQGLRQDGVQIEALACDVTDSESMTALFSKFGHQWPVLRGIIHAAVVIDDGLATSATEEQLQRVLTPKISGAELLARLAIPLNATHPLDFFVMYSSATTGSFCQSTQNTRHECARCWLGCH